MSLKLNALGLIAFLGEHSLHVSLGSLARNHITEYLPLLAGHVIPTDKIAEPISGCVVYNVSAAIRTTRVSPWFARWLLAQDLTWSSSVVKVVVGSQESKHQIRRTFAILLGVVVHALLITASCLLRDWTALAATVALTLSTLSRVSVLSLYRAWLNTAAMNGMIKSDSKVKVLVEMPDGKMITVHTAGSVLVAGLATEHRPRRKNLHLLLRTIGYLAFGCFIFTLGGVRYPMQLIIISLTTISSILAAKWVGSVDNHVGKYISIEQQRLEGVESGARMYAELQLDEKEEDVLTSWHLFPQKSNRSWWEAYEKFRHGSELNPRAFDRWPDHMTRLH